MIKVSMSFDPKDVNIDCTLASQYCSHDLKCGEDCPFYENGHMSIADLIRKYTEMIAAEVRDASN